jgi:hypothetical protein
MAKSDVKAPAKKAAKTTAENGKAAPSAAKGEITIAEKLVELYRLQHIDSQIDKIRTQRGELPLEVQDLEDEVAGLGCEQGGANARLIAHLPDQLDRGDGQQAQADEGHTGRPRRTERGDALAQVEDPSAEAPKLPAEAGGQLPHVAEGLLGGCANLLDRTGRRLRRGSVRVCKFLDHAPRFGAGHAGDLRKLLLEILDVGAVRDADDVAHDSPPRAHR